MLAFKRRFGLLALASLSLAFGGGFMLSAAEAQQPQQQQQQKRPPGKKESHPTNEFDTTILTTMPPMPLLPEYTGKGWKIVNALTYPNFKHGKCYTVRFNAREPQPMVHDWYMAALPMSGWKLKAEQTDNTTIVAKHTKQLATCTVVVQPSGDAEFRTEVMIRYIEQGK